MFSQNFPQLSWIPVGTVSSTWTSSIVSHVRELRSTAWRQALLERRQHEEAQPQRADGVMGYLVTIHMGKL